MKKTTLLIKRVLLLLILFFNTNLFAQNAKAQDYLSKRGELVFTFTASSVEQVQQLASFLSFDHGQDPNNKLTIRAIANPRQFQRFLEFGLPYTIDDALNSPKNVLMSNSKAYKTSSGKLSTGSLAAPLTFPLTAYPTYQDYADQMALFAANNPSICEMVNLGPTTEGDKDILFVKLSDNVSTNEQEPRLLYTSSMHGDEIAGYPMMLDLIDYFITAYNDTGHSDHTRVKDLLDNSEVWINPSANPDGTYYNDPSNTSVANARRANANGWDLNRNFPDNIGGAHPDGNSAYEQETQYFMDLADTYHFVISANFHGGTEVVNYPWDNTYTRHADDDWFFHISKEYAVNCQNDGAAGYMDAVYTNSQWPGVTNGADWYRVEGGRQDFMNYYHQCKETTIELSNIKTPAASELDDHWLYNKEALIDYLVQGTYGFRGVVRDAGTNSPIEARITLVGHDNTNSHTVSELPYGDYYRPVKAGTYDILFEADCYQSVTLSGQSIADYQTLTLADVLLTPIASSAPENLTASNVTGNSATIGWDSVTGATYDYRYRTLGAPSWTTNSTASNSESLTGLSPNTQYEVQVRSTCNANTSPYSGSVIFNTPNTIILHEGYFETGLDGWTEGGNDASRYTGSLSYEGSYSMKLRDNSGVSSSISSPTFNLSAFDSVTVSFYFYSNSMETGEEVWLRYNDGSGWATIASWASGSTFTDNAFNNVSFTLDAAQYNLVNNGQFRIQCNASAKNDTVYVDQVIISGTITEDTVAPVITLNGNATIDLNIGETYTELGATATDNVDGDISANIVIAGDTVDTNIAATYVVTYNVSDAAGNNAIEVTRTVNVTPDTTAPVITLIGSASIDLNIGDTYTEQGATAMDNVDGDISANIIIGGDTVDTNTQGIYSITYNVSDAAGNNATQVTRTINVTPDTTAPVITLIGSSTISLTIGDTYTEQGATANDNVDGDISANIIIGGDIVNTNTQGTYIVTYNVSDAAGNNAVEVTRTVNVAPDTTAPVITLISNSTINLNVGDTYTEQGATATDNVDGDISANIVIAGDTVDTNIAATYVATYNVSDSAGNNAVEVTRTVIVNSLPTDIVLHEGYFETGFDGWIDGGKDVFYYSGSFSFEGISSIRLRDSGTSASITSPSFNLSPYNQVEVNFYFYANGMNTGDGVLLQYNSGSGWNTVANWVSGTDFNDNAFFNAVFILDSAQYSLVNNGQFRIQCNASAKNDNIYVDQVIITGIGSVSSSKFQNSKLSNNSSASISAFTVYPNPVEGNVLNIKLSSGTQKISYRILSVLGEVVKGGKTSKEIDVSNLDAGAYFIEVVDENNTVKTKRFVKQ